MPAPVGPIVVFTPPLTLRLRQLPADPFMRRGIYGSSKRFPKEGKIFMPERALFLFPEAADSLMRMERDYPGTLFYSDILRSANGSLQARKEGAEREKQRAEEAASGQVPKTAPQGAQRPGFSGHNYGLSTDDGYRANMKRLGIKSKADYDAFKQGFGWYCHRKDGVAGFEAWHYNYFGEASEATEWLNKTKGRKSTNVGLQAKIEHLYGGAFKLDAWQIQGCLASLGLYGGHIDGKLGPLSRAAIASFQRAWILPATGEGDPMTLRTLAFVTAGRSIVG